jgi:hypothetical protein
VICGHIETESHGQDDNETVYRWTTPAHEDVEAFVRASVKAFEKELRRTIQDRATPVCPWP